MLSTHSQQELSNSQAAARRGFGGYKPGERKGVRTAEVKVDENSTVEQLKRIWLEHPVIDYYHLDHKRYHREIEDALSGLAYSITDIQGFSLELFGFQHWEYFNVAAGVFLNALINNGSEQDYIIHTAHLEVPIDSIGEGTTKNITIKGNVGVHTGHGMKGGKIIIEGDEGSYAGYGMEDGEIIIEGNAGTVIGWKMTGGKILAKKNAGGNVGDGMTGGEIIVRGNVGYFLGRHMEGGKITVLGNADEFAAEDMRGGTIVVEGNADLVIGRGMKGGVVHVNGKRPHFNSFFENGTIYHRGEQITGND